MQERGNDILLTMSFNQIRIIPSHQIDKIKWNKCIDEFNGTIYSQSFYLDIMCTHWEGVVLNDYQIIMPLTWRKKYGFYYLYQPAFIRHISIIGHDITDEIINAFLSSIPKHYKYGNIDLKEGIINPENITVSKLVFTKRRNYLLPLNCLYETIYNNYSRLARRMIRKAGESYLTIVKNCLPEDVINFYFENYKDKEKNISRPDYKNLITCALAASNQNKCVTYLAKTEDGITVAAYMLFKDKNFVYSIIGGSNKKGKESGAFYLLTDAAIKDHSGRVQTFRFEGSDKKGIAFFNSNFNPVPIHYYHLSFNRLPFLIKFLK